MPRAAPLSSGRPVAPAFLRLWQGFLTARVLVALALLALLLLGAAMGQAGHALLPSCALAYVVATVLLRVLAGRAPPAPQPGLHWLPSIGVDVLLIATLQALQPAGAINFTPLFGLPLLLASVLGTLTLALGTAAGVTLLLLAWTVWQGGSDSTMQYLQAALTGSGYFVVAYLTHQLAARLISEQKVAQLSQVDARTQRAISALVMQHVADGVLVLDVAGVVRLANPAALLLFGPHASPGVPFALAPDGPWAALLTMARETFALQLPQTVDVSVEQHGQPPMALRLRSWPTHTRAARAEDDEEALCVVFLHDLREMQARLRTEKLAAMGRMSAAVAHEIRNPLAAISQASQLLEEDLHDPVHLRLNRMVRTNTERLVRITEDVLDVARVHQSDNAPTAPRMELDATVRQVWADWQAHDPATRQGLLALEAPGAWAAFDPEHLRRVLVNLLDNAQRYRGPHADALCLSTRITPSGRAGVQVWSDGAPLDASVERHLFEPFFSSESRSSGLGLYICRELCRRWRASIHYQRASRQLARGEVAGNAFTVLFARDRASATDTAPPSGFDTIGA
ncbi:two-component system, NtrC family, sensor histidine kinase PilS [Oryzisolibacter propanilivorax]|uniref:histidine kinase n=1 Tax=Oryzisolibacter propanilivorax TaxID=1527607 RepID=A0A1G9RMN0_9BURK|nr:ATP-binding protein [Oryzisolibacter propanilivorax]SDM24444.1 two-component system, NtrC family, sensor histidine kinase PilS [Oryzisolibacter propanilivorax]